MRKSTVALSLALVLSSTFARADISPADGQNFVPYAISSGLMTEVAKNCLTSADGLQKDVLDASAKLNGTLQKFGMPAEEVQSNEDVGRGQVQLIVEKKSKEALCTPKVLQALGSWPQSVDAVITHLEEEAAKP